MTRFLVIGDLHGQMPKIYFKKNEFDAIIAPGDFCGDKPRRYMYEALKLRMTLGFDVDWYDLVGRDKALLMLKESLCEGRKVLEYLNSFNKPVFVLPGNWDWADGEDEDWKVLRTSHYKTFLIKGLNYIYDMHMTKRLWKGISIIGHGITSGPELPQGKNKKNYTKQELTEKNKEYQQKMTVLTKKFLKEKKPVIFLTHNVPYNTLLDKINNPSSPRNGEHFGSVIARKIIDQQQPLLCIGGHMHEYHGKQQLKKTCIINAGFGGKVNCLVDIDEKKGIIRSIKFIKGGKEKNLNVKVGW